MKTSVLVLTIVACCFSLLMGIGAGACVQGIGEMNRSLGNVSDANQADSYGGVLVLAGFAQVIVGGFGGVYAYRRFGTKTSLKWGLIPLVVAGLLSIANTCSFFTSGMLFFVTALLTFLGSRSADAQTVMAAGSLPPEVPPSAEASPSALGVGLNTVGRRIKSAGQLATLQAQRTKLVNLTLPSIHRALGRTLYTAKAYREDFPDIWAEFENLAQRRAVLKAQGEERGDAQGFAAKTKAAAAGVKDAAQAKALDLQIGQQFAKFGSAAYDKFGAESGPEELVKPITEACSQLAGLDEQIAKLSNTAPGQVFTPKRIMVVGICLLAFIGLVILGNLVHPSSNSSDGGRPQEVQSAASADQPSHEVSEGRSGGSVAVNDGSPQNVMTVSAPTLVDAFENNEIRANRRFKGKLLRVEGTVDNVKDMFGTPHVYLTSGTEPELRQVDCSFDGASTDELAQVSPGQSVTIQGRCTGLLLNVQIENCKIVR